MEEVWINGRMYSVDLDSRNITALNGNHTYVYCTFDAWDCLMEEPVKLQYVSVKGSKPVAEKPYRIIRSDENE